MEMINIHDWASVATITVEMTNGFEDTNQKLVKYKLVLQEFIPRDGDVLDNRWSDNGVIKTHDVPPFAIARMEDASGTIREYVNQCYVPAIVKHVGNSKEDLLWDTYYMAIKHSHTASVSLRAHVFCFTNADF
jgi:hypothetical protein